MTNGARIVGLLSVPKYAVDASNNPLTNSIVARVRALSGSAVEQGMANPDFAFTYQLSSEVMPYSGTQVPLNSTNFNDTTISTNEAALRRIEWVRVKSREMNSSEIKLTFRWPLFQNDQTGPGRQTFRAIVSGARTNIEALTFFQPQTFTAAAP